MAFVKPTGLQLYLVRMNWKGTFFSYSQLVSILDVYSVSLFDHVVSWGCLDGES